tara:strand:+ start:124 stop:510 length:387 start_codon:yes stop_codon:yes gene_type:complete
METLDKRIKASQRMVAGAIWIAEVTEKLAGIPAHVEIIHTGGGCTALAVLGVNKSDCDIIITQGDADAPDRLAIEEDLQVAMYMDFYNSDSVGETLQEVTYCQFDNEEKALDYILTLATLVKNGAFNQ